MLMAPRATLSHSEIESIDGRIDGWMMAECSGTE